jgi:hypothetical protein
MHCYQYSISQDGLGVLHHMGERQSVFLNAHLILAKPGLNASDRIEIQNMLESIISTKVQFLRYQTSGYLFVETAAN